MIRQKNIGVSPSGKATDSDSVIRWFESSYPSQNRAIFSDFLLKIALLFRFWEVFGK